MGELHLEIYVERMKREYGCECLTGKPRVAFRETITSPASFDYTHKKQSGGAGQFARVMGRLEPISADPDAPIVFENQFENKVVGGTVPTQYIPACEKGFLEACQNGSMIDHPVVGVKMILQDGAAHSVDSNEYSFRTASILGFRAGFLKAKPVILEPIMKVSISCPIEFQGAVMGLVNKRKGIIVDTEVLEEYMTITADVPLNEMFGYSTELRSATQGKGEFSMEYKQHLPVMPNVQEEMVTKHALSKQQS